MNKIKSYLGLCVKSNGIIIGQDRLKQAKKNPCLIVLSPNATDNLKDLAIRLGEKFHCKVLITYTILEELINISNCKIVGIVNINLAKAIENCDNEFTILRSSNDQ